MWAMNNILAIKSILYNVSHFFKHTRKTGPILTTDVCFYLVVICLCVSRWYVIQAILMSDIYSDPNFNISAFLSKSYCKKWETIRLLERRRYLGLDQGWDPKYTESYHHIALKITTPTSRSSRDLAMLRRLEERRLEARATPMPQSLDPYQRRRLKRKHKLLHYLNYHHTFSILKQVYWF